MSKPNKFSRSSLYMYYSRGWIYMDVVPEESKGYKLKEIKWFRRLIRCRSSIKGGVIHIAFTCIYILLQPFQYNVLQEFGKVFSLIFWLVYSAEFSGIVFQTLYGETHRSTKLELFGQSIRGIIIYSSLFFRPKLTQTRT